jgi:hypothetical protein
LKYFNYSNWSIEARSVFHGLTPKQGQQIASYIRSLTLPAPVQARPWNPPYQPGPGMDSKPVSEWSAGAGLDAILETDAETKAPLLASNALRPDKTLNLRELPIAMQLPDWNAWLPEVHPLDAAFTKPWTTGAVYDDVRDRLAGGVDALVASGKVADLLDNWQGQVYNFAKYTAPPADLLEREIANRGQWHWFAVKQWELMQKYGLEGRAREVYPKGGEARGWPNTQRNVFPLAPHAQASNGKGYFTEQSLAQGKYESAAWYQLQANINAGSRNATTLTPIDWNYHPGHINLSSFGGPRHPWRYVANVLKRDQQYDDGKPFYYLVGSPVGKSAIQFPQINPAAPVRVSVDKSIFADLTSADRALAYELILESFVDLVEHRPITDWPRTAVGAIPKDGELEPASYVPQPLTTSIDYALANRKHADPIFAALNIYKQAGVRQPTLERVVGWLKKVWPNADWASQIK